MGERDVVLVGGWTVQRDVLNRMSRELRMYHGYKLRVEYLRKRHGRLLEESSKPADGMPRGYDVSNPTLARAERRLTVEEEANSLAAWLHSVDEVRVSLSEAHRYIMDQLYFLPRAQRRLTMAGIAVELSMSEREVYRAKDEALIEFVLVLHGAANLGEKTAKDGSPLGET